MPLPETASTFETFGGLKEDYLAAAVDPDTDLPAACWNQAINDLAMVSRMTPQGWVTFDDSAVISHQALWGNSMAVKPTLDITPDGGDGQTWYDVTLPVSVADSLGVTRAINISGVFTINVYNATEPQVQFDGAVIPVGPNSFRVSVNATGDDPTFQVVYW